MNGKKTERQRLQHVSQVSSLLEFLDPSGTDILILGEDEGDAPWLHWAKPACDEKLKASGTIISYLTSLEKFYLFVTNPRYTRSMPPLHPSYVDCFKHTLPGLKGWRALVDATTQDDQHRRNLQERKETITPEELKDLQESEPYRNGLNAIQKAELGKDLSVLEFPKARDLLLVKLILTLGPRPGPLENVILEDWQNAEVCDGVKVLLVPKHKRSRTGPAPLACDADLQRLMEIYLQKIRPKFVAEERIKNIFVKNDGFPSGTIGGRFTAFWEKTGTIGRRFTAFWEKTGIREVSTSQTTLRKMYTTHTKKHAPEESGNIQKVLCHGEKSSRNCYLRDDLTVATAEAVNTLRAVTSIPLPKTMTSSRILPSTSSQSTSIPAATQSPLSFYPPLVSQDREKKKKSKERRKKEEKRREKRRKDKKREEKTRRE